MATTRWGIGLALLLLAACGGGDDDSGPAGDGDADADSDGDADGDGDADADCDAVTTSDDPEVQAYIDYVRGRMDEANIPGAAIAILEGGVETRILLGRREVGVCGPVTSDTRFDAGLVSMVPVQAAVVAADAEGLVDLDGSVAAIADVVPAEITFLHLLTRSSGRDPGSYIDPRYAEGCGSLESYFTEHAEDPLWFTPGTIDQANMQDTSLAAYALGLADESGWQAAIRRLVLEPLGMQSTWSVEEARDGELARGHFWEGVRGETGVQGLPLDDCEIAAPSQAMFASIDDMSRLTAFLVSDDPVARTLTGGSNLHFFGEGRVLLSGLDEMTQDADTRWLTIFAYGLGYYQEISIFPELDLAVTILLDGHHVSPDMGLEAARQLRGVTIEPFADATPPETWGEYAGTYVDPIGIDGVPRTIEVTWKPGFRETVRLQGCFSRLDETPVCADAAPCGSFFQPTRGWQDVTFADVFCWPLDNTTTFTGRFWRDAGGVPYAISTFAGEGGPPFYRQDDPL